jgi:adenine phosphoribosyltransferase
VSADMNLKDHIRSIPDFPKPGILFYDISTLLADARAWHETIERVANIARRYKPDMIAGIESRGFLLAAPLAMALGTGFLMLRKKGKLPGITLRHTYALEYGTDTIEIQKDAFRPGARVLLVDDLLATGGTLAAAVTLLESSGAVVPAAACIIELTFLEGRKKLSIPVEALLQYDS